MRRSARMLVRTFVPLVLLTSGIVGYPPAALAAISHADGGPAQAASAMAAPTAEGGAEGVALQRKFEGVWYRTPDKKGKIAAFLASGDLTLGRETISFTSEKLSLSIATSGVRNVIHGTLLDNDPSWTALMIAAAEGKESTVKLLLDAGANPNAANDLGRTSLMFASAYGYTPIVEALLARGANPNAAPKDDTGWTALIAAAAKGYRETVEALLKGGADPSLKDKQGFTARDHAKEAGHSRVARLLE